MASIMNRVADWFAAQCNDDWEHAHNISIVTLGKPAWSVAPFDKPGWSVVVPIVETSLANKSFDRMDLHRSEDDWLVCWVEGIGKRRTFELACGVYNLDEALVHFLDWAESAM